MNPKPRVFVEPSILQHSVPSDMLFWSREIKGGEMRAEVGLLPRIAELAQRGAIELLGALGITFRVPGRTQTGRWAVDAAPGRRHLGWEPHPVRARPRWAILRDGTKVA